MTSTARPKIAVVSGRYPATSFESYVNHRAYCARHGYTYIYCNWPTGAANKYLNKLEYIREYYDLFDYVFWIDDDAFFMRFAEGLEQFFPRDENYISICSSPVVNGVFTYVSSGQFMLRCSPLGRSFIDEALRVDLAKVRKWWPEGLGHFTRGDQDCFVYLMKTDDRFTGYDRHNSDAFNSRVEDVLSGKDVFILHITGGSPVEKQKRYRSVQRYLARGPSLLAEEEAARWNLFSPASMPLRVARRLRDIIRSLR